MGEYKVFAHPNGEVEAIKQGWSWPAFLFTFCWMFVKLWGRWGVILLIGYFSFGLVGIITGGDINKISNILTGIMGIMFMILLGTNGNRINEIDLLHRGFELKTEVSETNRNRAIDQYLKRTAKA
jgi:hypothetical protein